MLLPSEHSVFQINAETAVKLKSARESGLGSKTVREAVGAKERVRIEQPAVEMGVKVE
jgi:ribosomal protein L32E